MLDVLENTMTKRARIEAELRTDATRSDREISRIVGCDHKTVGSVRAGLGNSTEEISPTATERRAMLIAADADFVAKCPPETSEQLVDRVISEGKLSPEIESTVQMAVDAVRGAHQRIREERQAEAAEEDEANGEQLLVRPQREITIQFRDDIGEWVLKQKNWPDDDSVIWINEEHINAFLDALCERLGIVSIRGSSR